jgi:Predicted restriction endonuclease
MSNTQAEKYGSPWSRDELILAFDLYCRIPFSKTKKNNPAVIKLANLIDRTPSSVARKLGNFGSFDPALKQQNISGLAHASKADAVIWQEFNNNWNALVWEAESLRNLLEKSATNLETSVLQRPSGASERTVVRKERVHQSFFREAIITSYEQTCCITGLRIRECLIASHIIPWSESEEHRTDPHNGLCLSATFDRLFDRGLITISNEYTIIASSVIVNSQDNRVADLIGKYHEQPIIPPSRFMPSLDYLAWHREHLFRK